MSSRRLQVNVQPTVLRWARERRGLSRETLARKASVRPDRVDEWEETGTISVAKLDKVAHHTHTPLGFLFLDEPVEGTLPIPDFRTVEGRPPSRPSPELLDTLHAMQRRQEWFRDDLIERGYEPLPFIASVGLDTPVAEVAGSIRGTLGFDDEWAQSHRSWIEALRALRRRAEAARIVVVTNSIIANNTHRPLDRDEFRGFALVDEYAPLVFINGADFVSAQMFTLVHELAHLWIAESGISTFETLQPIDNRVEVFCNAVAAETLVPRDELTTIWDSLPQGYERYSAAARAFKVSTIVAARRALDLQLISRPEFYRFYESWHEDEARAKKRGGGRGIFWNTQRARVGHRYGLAVVRAVKEGRLLYRDAYKLTDLKASTFDRYIERMEGNL